MRAFRTVVLLCLLFTIGAPLSGAAPAAAAQDVALAARGPRFLFAPSSRSAPVEIDARSNLLLRRVVSLDIEQPTVGRVLAAIEGQTGLKFAFSPAILAANRPVALQATTITVGAALFSILMDTGVDVLLSPGSRVTLVERVSAPSTASGAIVGRVTDAKTQAALAGATVVVQGTNRSVTTGGDGRYRIADVAPGAYTVRARYIGYAPGSASVTVVADQAATADFTLERSAQRLDEVVTTGTVTPTEVKAMPTPISVVTGDEIVKKGYQRVDQIFRGDVPGVNAWDQGTLNHYSTITVRGASSLGGTADYVKTYIDGVEVADPSYIATIDPNSIERIEVLRGPQGSTIYGSQAMAGVIQIFTKKGDLGTTRPQVEAKVSAGLIQSEWDHTVRQDHALAVTGGSKDFSYRLGGGWIHDGDWVPQTGSTNTSLYGGARGTQGPVTVEFSARSYGKSFGGSYDPDLSIYPRFSKPIDQSRFIRQQTYGINFKYAATPHWQHNLVLGYDRNAYDISLNRPRLLTPADSFLSVYASDVTKASVAYNTTYDVSLGRAARATLTAGVDHWKYEMDGFDAGRTTSVTSISSPDDALRSVYHNTGYFAQTQVGVSDALFLTAGLRGEANSNFGQDYGLAWAPRVGVAYVQMLGDVTAKARVAYGKAIRPPDPDRANTIVYSNSVQLGNPKLGPEEQRGWDGGLELYFGHRGSLEVSYYNQTALNLVDFVNVPDPVYTLAFQYENVGRVKNTGWEFQGRLNAGALSLTGTYSITSSVVQELSPSYTGDLLPGDQVLHIPRHTAGAALSYSLARTAVNLGMTYVGSWTEVDDLALYGVYFGGQPYRGSGRAYWITYPSFTKFNLSLSQALTDRLSVFLQADNLTNKNVFEDLNVITPIGRVTTFGVRTKF